jgi:hypothetical protein
VNIAKAQVKQATLESVGNRLDDQAAACEKNLHQVMGGKTALVDMTKVLNHLYGVADKELDDGIIPDLETLKLVKKWIGRAIESTAGKAKHLENMELIARGRVEQSTRSVETVQKLYVDHATQMKAVLDQIDAGVLAVDANGVIEQVGGDRRVVGTPPGPTLKQQRAAEVEAAKPKTNGKGKGRAKAAKPRAKRKKKGADANNP